MADVERVREVAAELLRHRMEQMDQTALLHRVPFGEDAVFLVGEQVKRWLQHLVHLQLSLIHISEPTRPY
eukprot:763589-Hanusia_phi.AAC.2